MKGFRRFVRGVVVLCVGGYALGMLMLGAYLRFVGDSSNIGALLLFGPRWILVLPWAALVIMALFVSRWLAAIAVVATAFTAFVVADFEVPSVGNRAEGPQAFRLVSYNTDRSSALPMRLREDFAAWKADVIVLQDCTTPITDTLRAIVGRNMARISEYCIASRIPVERVDTMPIVGVGFSRTIALRIRLRTTRGPIDLFSVHFESPRDALFAARHMDFSKLGRSTERRGINSRSVAQWHKKSTAPTIVAGDFNLPTGSSALRRDWSHMQDAFAERGWGFGYTMFAGHYAVRIDHVLLSEALAATEMHVLSGYPSEHQPLVVDIAWRR